MAWVLWTSFLLLVVFGIALDLGVFHRTPRPVGTREALAWTAFWVVQALAFSGVVHYAYSSDWQGLGIQLDKSITGSEAVWMYLAGYLTEKSLSLDNVVVMALIFSYFRVPLALQHRVLVWGVLGALVLRLIMIVAGSALIREFSWITYVFGAFLIFSAARMLTIVDDHMEPEKNAFVCWVERVLPVHDAFEGPKFLLQRGGKLHLTRLAIVLALVESSDLIFAVDSIPAIFGITTDPFLILTSNVFAILGLRSLYFAIAPMIEQFRYLKTSLVFLLAFVGVKLLLTHHTEISPLATLGAILGIVSVGVLASLIAPRTESPSDAHGSPAESPQREGARHAPLGLSFPAAHRLARFATGAAALLVVLSGAFAPRGHLELVAAALGGLLVAGLGSRWLLARCATRSVAEPPHS